MAAALPQPAPEIKPSVPGKQEKRSGTGPGSSTPSQGGLSILHKGSRTPEVFARGSRTPLHPPFVSTHRTRPDRHSTLEQGRGPIMPKRAPIARTAPGQTGTTHWNKDAADSYPDALRLHGLHPVEPPPRAETRARPNHARTRSDCTDRTPPNRHHALEQGRGPIMPGRAPIARTAPRRTGTTR